MEEIPPDCIFSKQTHIQTQIKSRVESPVVLWRVRSLYVSKNEFQLYDKENYFSFV